MSYGLGDNALCIDHAPTRSQLCSFVSKQGGSTTAAFVPRAAQSTDPLKLLVWFHGDLICGGEGKNILSYVWSKTFPLARQIVESNLPYVLVLPTMNWTSGNNQNSHPLGSPRRFNAFLNEVRDWLTTAGWTSPPSFGRLILAGHSRAYVVLNDLASAVNDAEFTKGALATLTDIWLLDTTYGKANKLKHCTNWINWAKVKSDVNLHILYRQDTDTAAVAECIRDEAQVIGLNNVVVEGLSSHCSMPRDHLPTLLARSRSRVRIG